MIIKEGEYIPKLGEGMYGVKLVRHDACSLVGPLVEAGLIVDRATNLNYYTQEDGALEDLEIVGPFEHLELMVKN